MVEFSQSLFEAEERSGEVEICLRKDLVTASAFTVTLTPQETAPNPPETFRARGKILLVKNFGIEDVRVNSPHTGRKWSAQTTTQQFLPPLRLVLPPLTESKKC